MKPPQEELFWSGIAEWSEVQKDYERWKKALFRLFICAVADHDRAGIMKLADAAEFFADKLEGNYMVDPTRYKILELWKISGRGYKNTIHDVADHVDGKREHPSDRLSQLRRVCKSLKFPLKAIRKTPKHLNGKAMGNKRKIRG